MRLKLLNWYPVPTTIGDQKSVACYYVAGEGYGSTAAIRRPALALVRDHNPGGGPVVRDAARLRVVREMTVDGWHVVLVAPIAEAWLEVPDDHTTLATAQHGAADRLGCHHLRARLPVEMIDVVRAML